MNTETELQGAIAIAEQLQCYRQALIHYDVTVRAQAAKIVALSQAISTLQADSRTLQRQNTWLKVGCLVMGLGLCLSFVNFL